MLVGMAAYQLQKGDRAKMSPYAGFEAQSFSHRLVSAFNRLPAHHDIVTFVI